MVSVANKPALILARGMTADGYIVHRFVNPDGTLFTGTRTDEMRSVLDDNPPFNIWHSAYGESLQITTAGEYKNSERMRANLLHFSYHHPLIFDETLNFLKDDPSVSTRVVAFRLHSVDLTQPKKGKHQYPADRLRNLLKIGPMLSELIDESPVRERSSISSIREDMNNARYLDKIMGRGVLAVGDYGHPLLRAACVAAWIMRDSSDWRHGVLLPEAVKDVEFIDTNLDAVITAQEELSQRQVIDRKIVAAILNHAAPLRVGVL